MHFLLGKMEHEDTICYILAVPGIYEERERLLANLFGFPYFKSARAKAAQPGPFRLLVPDDPHRTAKS